MVKHAYRIVVEELRHFIENWAANVAPVALIIQATKQTRRFEDRSMFLRIMIGAGIQLATALIAVIAGSYITLKLVEQDVANLRSAVIDQAKINERDIQRLDNKDVVQDGYIFKHIRDR